MQISVVVPCFNEESVIEMTYSRLSEVLKKDNIDYELIFVNDGSSDKTKSVLKKIADGDESVKYISFSRNFGKEAAMLAGLTYSKGEYVAIMDADLQHPPELLKEMLKKAQSGYDQVIAKRNRKGDGFCKTLSARLYYKMVNSLVDVKLTDGVGDFRVLSRRAVDAILQLKEYNRFSKGIFSWIGFSEAVIEYENQERAAGETKWSFRRLFQYGLDGILSFNDKPLRICLVFGLIIAAISALYLIYLLINIIISGSIDVPGYFTTIFTVCLFGGIQLISIGIIGEYVGRIYYEVKKRPHYLIEDTNADKESIK